MKNLVIFLFALFLIVNIGYANQPQDQFLKALGDFEQKLWSGEKIQDEQFNAIQTLLIEHLDAELTDSQPNITLALNYLEKLKTLRLIRLFYPTILFREIVPRNADFLLSQWKPFYKKYSEIYDKNSYPDTSAINSQSFAVAVDSARKLNPLLINCLVWQKPILTRQYQAQLTAREVILDYWMNKDLLAAFVISRDSINLIKWAVDSARFVQGINQFQKVLFEQSDMLDLKFDIDNGYFLYSNLIKPIESQIGEHSRVIIIPERPFISLPFECLVAKHNSLNPDNQTIYDEYAKLDFLIKKYAISYCYSLSSLDAALTKIRSQEKLGRRLLTMSEPSFTVDDDSMAKLISPIMLLNRSSDVNDEIRRVSRLLFRHDILRGPAANFEYLKTRAQEYRWIYLAQLGILSPEEPLKSALMISPDSENSSQWLDADKILSIPFRADMITLSGTTLLPNKNRDYEEATIALPQEFLIAGNKSVVFSFWHVHSSSTSEFMSKFYWELKYKRRHNTLALRGAKIASLNDSFNYLGQKISTAHPYFWAGFRLIGSPYVSSPSNAKIPPLGLVVIVYLVVFIVSLIITRKTKSRE